MGLVVISILRYATLAEQVLQESCTVQGDFSWILMMFCLLCSLVGLVEPLHLLKELSLGEADLQLGHCKRIDRAVVGCELFFFEEVDGSVVQLQDHDSEQHVKAFHIFFQALHVFRELSDFVHFVVFGCEERLDLSFGVLKRIALLHICHVLLLLGKFILLHLIALINCRKNRFQVKYFERHPLTHDHKWILQLP